jgi:hypothetical protein
MSKYDEEGLIDEGLGPLGWFITGFVGGWQAGSGNVIGGARHVMVEYIISLLEGSAHVEEKHSANVENIITAPVAIPEGFVVPKGTGYTVTVSESGATVDVTDGSVVFLDPVTNNTATVVANQTLTLPPPAANGFTMQTLQQGLSASNANSVNQWWQEPTVPNSSPSSASPQSPSFTIDMMTIVVAAVAVAIVVMLVAVMLLRKRKRSNTARNPPFPPPPP